jgi:hypothetical protein
MYLVLCSPQDRSARWAYEALCNNGLAPVEFVTSEQLAYGRLWEHRVGENTPSVRIVLGDGRTIWSNRVTGVLNRLVAAPSQLVNFAQRADRDYAMQELTSFYLSWLQALPGVVIGRPEPQGFCGRWRHASEWAVLAQRSGLPTPVYRQSANDDPSKAQPGLAPQSSRIETLIALKDRLFGTSMPEEIVTACLHLASLADSDLLGISLFQAENGVWNFDAATPYPDFMAGGQDLIEHLASVFSKGTVQ